MAFSKEKAHERAEKFAAKGQHDKAAREYQSIVEQDPKDIRAWLMLADCLVRCGDRPGAVERYLQVAGYYAAQKQPQKALAVYRQVVNLDPRRIDVHQRIAQLNLELGRVQDAVSILEQVGHAQLQAGNTTEAIATFETIANAEPTAVSKRLRIAELYSREGQSDKAVEHFRAAGDQLLSAGRKSDYVRVAERLIYHHNDDKSTIRTLARVYLELGDPRRSLMKLNALLHGDSHDREGLELLAETFVALEKPDKATSVVLELVRELRHAPDGAREAVRVARRALEWAPKDPELLAVVRDAGSPSGRRGAPMAQTATAPQSVPPEFRRDPSHADELAAPEEIDADVEDSEVLELDDADVISSDSAQIQLDQPQPASARAGGVRTRGPGDDDTTVSRGRGSMTDSVLEDVQATPVEVELDGSVDYDKILFEARVYIKYRLFEHAIEHVGELLAMHPDHVGALALRARAYGELGRKEEAATTHVRVAQLVAARDPKLAREHIAAALAEVPGHMGAVAMQNDIEIPRHAAGSGDDGVGDSGTFDVVGDSQDIDLDRDDHSFAIEVAADESAEVRRPVVENRFGLSDAHQMPAADERRRDRENAMTEDLADAVAAARRGFDPSDERADRTPLVAFKSRAPQPGDDDELRVEPDVSTGRFGPPSTGIPEKAFDLDEDESLQVLRSSVADIVSSRDEPARRSAMAAPAKVAMPAAKITPAATKPAATKPAATKPVATTPAAATTGRHRFTAEPVRAPAPARDQQWVDLGDELAEIRFYVDQGLEDDARTSLAELEKKHPGHPEIRALQSELEYEAAPRPDSGAKPLVSLSVEDEEEDAYLSAIFGGGEAAPKPAAKKQKGSEIRASATGVEPGDAATSYDLGIAYKDMGLVDDAIAQLEAAARDPAWEARALVMIGTLRVHRGETDKAISDLMRALDAATNQDELYEAQYELGVVYETIGDLESAREQLQAVAAGYRDRDERLARLGR